MSEEANIIHTQFAGRVEALRAGGLSFLLVGGLSLLAHQVERGTGGIDLACERSGRDLAARLMAEAETLPADSAGRKMKDLPVAAAFTLVKEDSPVGHESSDKQP